jgi:hypothetical protein
VTVEFHNSKNAVWTAIQEALGRAGFIIGDVSVLDNGMKTKKQLHAKAVDKDLVISAYKPNGWLEKQFELEAGTEDGVWDFIRTHLRQLPVFITKSGIGQVIAERQHVLLFDRMVAFHVQRGVTVPLSAADLYAGLAQRYSERDGMYFLTEQVAEYDKKRLTVKEILELQLFVTDESSAIQWLRQQLLRKPQTAGELKPQFMQEIGGWQKTEKLLELDELLEQNFLRFDGKGEVPNQIHSYLSTNFRGTQPAEGRREPACQGQGPLVCARPEQGGRSGEAAREVAAQGVRGIPGTQPEAPEGVPPRSGACRFQEGMAGARLRHHHHRGPQDSRDRPPGGLETAYVVRPGAHAERGRMIHEGHDPLRTRRDTKKT